MTTNTIPMQNVAAVVHKPRIVWNTIKAEFSERVHITMADGRIITLYDDDARRFWRKWEARQ